MRKCLFLAVLFLVACQQAQEVEEWHTHADFALFIEGKLFDFAQEEYMSTEDNYLSNFIHLHDDNGEVLHKHYIDVTLGEFFYSINMSLSSECIKIDDERSFCNSQNKEIKMFVNGERNYEFQDYDIQDLDRILITYGSETEEEIVEQIQGVTDKACIQSGTCPERGSPSDESSCATESGCPVV